MASNKKYHAGYNLTRYHRKMSSLRSLFGNECNICGSNNNLHFHHVDPSTKKFTIGSKVTNLWEDVIEEANKCELLCEPCHKEQHKCDHGITMYTHHRCRCDVCKDAYNSYMRDYKREWRKKKKQSRVPIVAIGPVL